MKNILYIGNNLKNRKSNPSGIQVLGPLLEKEGYSVRYASSRTNKLRRLIDMVFSCVIHAKSTDAVLIDTYSTQNFYYAWIIGHLCQFLKLPYITILHGGNLPTRLQSHPKKSRSLFENAHYNVAPSLYIKRAFEDFGIDNLIHIPNSIEIKKYPFEQKAYEVPKLLWVRSFSKIYNPSMAIKVLNQLQKTYNNAELCMVGPDSDGSLKEVMALVETLELSVKFTGKLSKEDWVALSKDYNIFLNTTNFDNMPLSVVEAMALGFPIVSTNVGGIPYLIEDQQTGLLVEPENVEGMTNAILGILKNSESRQAMISAARIQAEKLDWKHIKPLWIHILNHDFS
ncbi:MAG: glycosyltransferase family 4 protein [Algicola sp.]|nr:glycosyltransferase family 4 protein [Algicola sp.]